MSEFSLFLLHFLSADTTYDRDGDDFIAVIITLIWDQSFQNSIVNCTSTGSCIVHGAEHSSIIMECNQMYGCVNAVINATDSTSFDLFGCSDYMSCIGMTIVCPPNIDGVPQCNFLSMYSTSLTFRQSEEIEFPIIFHSELISR